MAHIGDIVTAGGAEFKFIGNEYRDGKAFAVFRHVGTGKDVTELPEDIELEDDLEDEAGEEE